jgi:ribosomal protein S18 acetylase RimI-like enzyme
VAPTLRELAEHTEVHLLPRYGFETVRRDGYVYVAGQRGANVHPYRVDDLESAIAWTRAESRRRGHHDVEWWIGWTAEPTDVAARLEAQGLARNDDPPALTGMTCSKPPPEETSVAVRRVETLEEYLAMIEVDFHAWSSVPHDLEERRQRERDRFAPMRATGTVHHFAGFLDGELVGFGRAIDMDAGVALFGGAVLPHARGRGVYRALVRARWEHAAARGTPLLVVQAGPMSEPILARLGFRRHGRIELYCDRL